MQADAEKRAHNGDATAGDLSQAAEANDARQRRLRLRTIAVDETSRDSKWEPTVIEMPEQARNPVKPLQRAANQDEHQARRSEKAD